MARKRRRAAGRVCWERAQTTMAVLVQRRVVAWEARHIMTEFSVWIWRKARQALPPSRGVMGRRVVVSSSRLMSTSADRKASGDLVGVWSSKCKCEGKKRMRHP
jgi:hypothetical protein